MSPETTLAWIDPRTLDDEAREELWRFVTRYEDISFAELSQRLDQLCRAFVGRHASGEIGALVAGGTFTAHREGRACTMILAEWGLCDPPFRGRMLLERAVLKVVLRTCLRHPTRPIYLLSEAASDKGYLALARFFADGLWPRPGHPLPDAERRMADGVLARAGDPDWDPVRGVFHRGKPMRMDGSAPVPASLHALSEFYRSLNPGYAEGDSLLCVARVSWWTLATAPLRALLARRRRPSARAA